MAETLTFFIDTGDNQEKPVIIKLRSDLAPNHVKQITDLVSDRSIFGQVGTDPGAFDGAPDRAADAFLAGDYTWDDYPATLEGAVRSGRRAARQAMEIAPAA